MIIQEEFLETAILEICQQTLELEMEQQIHGKKICIFKLLKKKASFNHLKDHQVTSMQQRNLKRSESLKMNKDKWYLEASHTREPGNQEASQG